MSPGEKPVSMGDPTIVEDADVLTKEGRARRKKVLMVMAPMVLQVIVHSSRGRGGMIPGKVHVRGRAVVADHTAEGGVCIRVLRAAAEMALPVNASGR
jgi:hypothetical protein